MENFKKRNKILVVISVFILLVIALLISKATYSFLEPMDPDDVIINSEITATGDTLLFTKGTDINVVLSQDNFNSASGNLVRSVTPQVKLIASNKTNNAEATYYVSLNISENTFKYTNGTSNPEILLTVTDNEGNPLTTCTGLTYTTVGGVSGFDITNKIGVYDFAEQTISTTSSTTGTTKNWTFTITFINKTTDQSINEDAKINLQAILHREPQTFCELNPDNGGCRLNLAYNPSVSKNVITLDNGYIYYHDSDLENGAGDYSYRYAGTNPNNYICFGSDAATCPAENIYRIIGLMPVDVVTDSTTTPVTTERQMLYKIIKNDYITENEMSTGLSDYGNSIVNPYNGPSGNLASNPQGYYWVGYYTTNVDSNTWSESELNTIGLNGTFLNSLGLYSQDIANVMWKVGGSNTTNMLDSSTINQLYINEITDSGNGVTNFPNDGKNEIPAKAGLVYISDYAYASIQSSWTTRMRYYSNNAIIANDWLYRGVKEWTITRVGDTIQSYYIDNSGRLNYGVSGYGVRPVFYLKSTINIDFSSNAGTLSDPYRVEHENSNYCDINTNDFGCKFDSNFDSQYSNIIKLDNGYIYYHGSNLVNGANDGSYRYSGANPNNYICFGSDAATCPAENIYRIIGLIPVDVVTDSTTNPVTTERQMLYKIIKHNYLTSGEMATGTGNYNGSTLGTYNGPSGNQASNPQGYYWSGSSTSSNTWGISSLNTNGLNGEFLSNIGTWSNNIANVIWKVGGRNINDLAPVSPMSVVYTNEITNSGISINTAPSDGKNEIASKVGLLYLSDYGYAAKQTIWNIALNSYTNRAIANNWLYRGVYEWTITRYANESLSTFYISNSGKIGATTGRYAIRPTFYLTEDTIVDMTNHAGTLADPYRISN